MGTRWEAVEAQSSGFDWHTPLEEIDNWGTMDPNQYGISVGDGVMIHGTADELVEWAATALEYAKKAQAHAAKPITLEDFIPDDDGDYSCPRCGTMFRTENFLNLSVLIREVQSHNAGHNGAA